MLLSLLIVPIIGVFIISAGLSFELKDFNQGHVKSIALTISIINLLLSLMVFILFDFSSNQFQFVQEYHEISSYEFYLGVDGLSIYFVLLTTMIMPIVLLSNWRSINENVRSYVIIVLLLETLLLAVFLVLDILLFYIFFESILPPLFLLIGLFGSSNKVRASFYLFLYTLFGSLFLLLSILTMSSIMGITDFEGLYKTNFNYYTQLLLFLGIFFAFAVKTPTIFLNAWLLKGHVESPLGGSIILAGIVLKLSIYGVFRLILPLLPKVYLEYTYIVYLIGVITIIYASFSTLRTIDIKELIAYSSVCHAAVYLIGVFSNTIQGIEGGIILGLAHGFVSSGLFICAGGILYDRSSTRLITRYRGTAQIMPLFSILFFILCLGNSGTPLTLNFVGEFMSLYGAFKRLVLLGALACSSVVFSAAYSMFMYNRIAFGGTFSRYIEVNISDLNKREFLILLTLVTLTVVLGIYPATILDGLHYSVSSLNYSSPNVVFDLNIAIFTLFLKQKRKTSKMFILLKKAILRIASIINLAIEEILSFIVMLLVAFIFVWNKTSCRYLFYNFFVRLFLCTGFYLLTAYNYVDDDSFNKYRLLYLGLVGLLFLIYICIKNKNNVWYIKYDICKHIASLVLNLGIFIAVMSIIYIIGLYSLNIEYFTLFLLLCNYNAELDPLYQTYNNVLQGNIGLDKLEVYLYIDSFTFSSLLSSFLVEYTLLMDGNQGFNSLEGGNQNPYNTGGGGPSGGDGTDPWIYPGSTNDTHDDGNCSYAKVKGYEHYPQNYNTLPPLPLHNNVDNNLNILKNFGVSKVFYNHMSKIYRQIPELVTIDIRAIFFLDPFITGKPSGLFHLTSTGLPSTYSYHTTFHDEPLELYRLHRYRPSSHLYWSTNPPMIVEPNPVSMFNGFYVKDRNDIYIPYNPTIENNITSFELYVYDNKGYFKSSWLYGRRNKFSNIQSYRLEAMPIRNGVRYEINKSPSEILNIIHSLPPMDNRLEQSIINDHIDTENARRHWKPMFADHYWRQMKEAFELERRRQNNS